MRYRLRTLMNVLALLSVLLAGASFLLRPREMWSVPLDGGSRTIVFKARPSIWGNAISVEDDSVTASLGGRFVIVNLKSVFQPGVRDVRLPANWKKAEVTLVNRDIFVVVDGTLIK